MHSRTSSNLTNELFTLNAIEDYESGLYNNVVESDDFRLLLKDMRSSDDVNDFSDDIIGERLKVQDYDLQRALRDIAFHIVGKELSETHVDLGWLEDKEDSMGHAFWLSLEIKYDYLAEMVENLDVKTILRASRNMADHDDNLYSWCKKNIREDMAPADVIAKIDLYNNGAYTELRCGVDILAYILLRERHWDLWMQMLYKLQYFPLQGAMIYSLHTITEVLTVMNKVQERDEWHAPILLWLLRERLFSVATDERLNLVKNMEEEGLDDATKDLLKTEYNSFNEEFENAVSEGIATCCKTFTNVDSLNWYARKELQSLHKIDSIKEADLKTLDVIDRYLTDIVSPTEIDCESLCTNTLLYYSEVLRSKNANKELCCAYIKSLCNHLYRDCGFLAPQLSDRVLNRMRCVYMCLEESGIDGLDLTSQYRPKEQRNDVEYYKELFQSQKADSYWLSMMMLQSENKEDSTIIQSISEFIYNTPIIDQSLNNNYYFLPLYIGEMVVTQVITSYKDNYEARLIESNFSLIMILRILTANEGKLSKDNRTLLMKRIGNSWEKECQYLTRFDKGLQEHLQKYIEKIR